MNYKHKYLQLKNKLYKGGSESFNYFDTDITHDGPIIALSDIHGDIHAFIIALRDCAKVISKNNYNPKILDTELEIELIKDLNNDCDYDDTLGYI